MTTSILLVAVLPALLLIAAISDLTSFTIPNAVPVAMLALFIVFLMEIALGGHAMSVSATGWHLLAGVIGLLTGMGLFAVGWVGGGDAKLFAAVSLWLGWDVLFEYALVASLLGGALTLAVLLMRRFPLPSFLASRAWLAHLADPRAGIPYGVALATAALVVLPDTELFRLAGMS